MKFLKKNSNGSSVVEFVLVLPWLLGGLLAVVTVAMWVTEGQLLHYAAFKAARAVSVYENNGALLEMEALLPGAESAGIQKNILYVQRRFWGLKQPWVAHAPIFVSLQNADVDLDEQSMDNPIGFCGHKGDYHLCEN